MTSSPILVLLAITSDFRSTAFPKSLQHRVVMGKKTSPRPSSVFFFLSVCMMRITETLNFVRPGSMQDGLCPNAVDLTWGDVVRCRAWNSQRGVEGPHSLLDFFCSSRRKAFPPHRQMSKQILPQRFELQVQAAILSIFLPSSETLPDLATGQMLLQNQIC